MRYTSNFKRIDITHSKHTHLINSTIVATDWKADGISKVTERPRSVQQTTQVATVMVATGRIATRAQTSVMGHTFELILHRTSLCFLVGNG